MDGNLIIIQHKGDAMKKSNKHKTLDKIPEYSKKTFTLEDRQSIRTTFNLTKETSEQIKSLVKDRGITVKELFEILCFDIFDILNEWFISEGVLKKEEWKKKNRQVRKTYVISKRTFTRLNDLSKGHQIPRDVLVEHLFKTYQIVNKLHLKKIEESKKNHKKALQIMEDFLSISSETRGKLREILIEEDPIVERFEHIDIVIHNLVSDIESEISDGTPIDTM